MTGRILRIAGTLVLLGWVASRLDFGDTTARLLAFDPAYLPHVLAAILAGSLLSVWKWSLILRASGLRSSFGSLYRIFWIGSFFNSFMPGRTGGDLVRAYAVSRSESRRREAAFSVVLDRFFSLFALILIGLAATLVSADERFRPVGASILGIAVAACGVMALGAVSERWSDRAGRFGRIVVRPLASSLMAVIRRPVALLAILGLAVLFQVTVVLFNYAVAAAIGLKVDVMPFFVLIPVASLVSAIPVSINGFGVREAAYGVLFATVGMGMADAVSISLMSVLCAMAASLVGAGFLLTGPIALPRTEPTSEHPA